MKPRPCLALVLLILATASVRAVTSPEKAWSNLQAEIAKSSRGQPAEVGYRLDQASSFIDAALREKRYAGVAAYVGYLQQQAATASDRYKEALAAFVDALKAAQEAEGARREAAADKIEADFVSLLRAHAPATAFDALLKQLAALSNDEFDRQWTGQSASVGSQKISQLQLTVSRWQDYLLARDSHDAGRAQSAVRELMQQNERPSALTQLPRSEWVTLLADAQRQVGNPEEESRNDVSRRLAAALAELPAQIERAKAPADLDAPIAAMTGLEREINQLPYNVRQSQVDDFSRAGTARHLLMKWQDRLFALADGNPAKANAIANEMANSSEGYSTLLPRSKLLGTPDPKRGGLDAAPVPVDMSDLVPDTLEGLPAAIEAMNARSHGSANPGSSRESGYTAALFGAYKQLQSGDPIEAFRLINPRSVYSQYYPTLSPKLTALRQQLTVRAVRFYFNLPADFDTSSKDNPAAVFNDAVAYAHRKSDLPSVLKIIDYWQYNFPMWPAPNFDLAAESRALGAYLAGLNQERALQFDMAVVSFKRSLRQPSRFLPAEEVGRHLEEIKAKHPEDFQKADKRVAEEAQRKPNADYSYPTNVNLRPDPNDYPKPGHPAPAARPGNAPAAKPPGAQDPAPSPKTY